MGPELTSLAVGGRSKPGHVRGGWGLALGIGVAGGRALAGAWASTRLVGMGWWGLVMGWIPFLE